MGTEQHTTSDSPPTETFWTPVLITVTIVTWLSYGLLSFVGSLPLFGMPHSVWPYVFGGPLVLAALLAHRGASESRMRRANWPPELRRHYRLLRYSIPSLEALAFAPWAAFGVVVYVAIRLLLETDAAVAGVGAVFRLFDADQPGPMVSSGRTFASGLGKVLVGALAVAGIMYCAWRVYDRTSKPIRRRAMRAKWREAYGEESDGSLTRTAARFFPALDTQDLQEWTADWSQFEAQEEEGSSIGRGLASTLGLILLWMVVAPIVEGIFF